MRGAAGEDSGSRFERRFLAVVTVSTLCVVAAGELTLITVFERNWIEALASIAIFLSAIAVTLTISWTFFLRLLRPLRAIESSIEAFSRGAPAEEAEATLPSGGPKEVAYLADRIGEYMRRTRGSQAELEAAVAGRTLELELRNALLRSMSSSDDDDQAYSSVVEAVIEPIGADCALAAFYDELRILRAARRTGGVTVVDRLRDSEIEALERAASGLSIDLPFLSCCAGFAAVYRLESQGEECGFIALGRRGAAFTPAERSILERTFASFSLQARLRKRRSRDGYVRREAEQALRKSEERLRAFFAESKDMIYTTNADDVVASINDAGVALLGFSDRFEVVGQPFSGHLLSAEDRRSFLSRIRERGFVVDFECVFLRKGGSPVFCLESARSVKDAAGKVIEIQGIVKDISERIASERELWKANLELAEANEKLQRTKMIAVQQEKLASIGQLAAGVAHEINNPLGFLSSNQKTIASFLKAMRAAWEEAAAGDPGRLGEIAARRDLDYVLGELEAVLAESHEGFRRIIDIVQHLKSFARMDDSQVMSPYDLNEGIKSTLVVARNEIKYVADVELDLAELPPVMALGGEINQVLLNILVNAAQAIESQKREGRGRIAVSTYAKGGRVGVAISDDGPGVPEQHRLKVFDPFFTTKEPGKGTGLGLALSYDIVTRKHSGSLVLEESPQGGALFRIELPIGQDKPSE